MDSTLYNRIYGDGVNEEIILRHAGYLKPRHLYYLIKDYVWRARPKVENKKKAPIIKVNQ